MREHERRRPRVAGGAYGELGAVERPDDAEVLGREQREHLAGLGVGVAVPADDRAADDAARDRARGEPGRHDRRATAAHPRYSRGTRSEIAVTIS